MDRGDELSVGIELKSGMHFEGRTADSMAVSLDASPDHGGTGLGSSPMELLLVSLGTCTGMDIISILRKKRQDISSYRIDVVGRRSTEYPCVFTTIEIHHLLQGNSLSEEAARRAIELSETKYCPIFAMLSGTVELSSSFKIQPAAPLD